MGSSKRDKDDAESFSKWIEEQGDKVTPIKKPQTHHHQPRKPAPVPTQRIADETAVIAEMADGSSGMEEIETGDELSYQGPGVQNKVFRKLKRGQFTITAELDLHGLTADQAKAGLSGFLRQCVKRHQCCVRIIHGKGLRSKDGKPVIKNKIGGWLQQRQEVLAYCPARQVDGGTGALYVLVKKISAL